MTTVNWTLNRTPTGYEGTIEAELPDGRIVRARGGSRETELDAPAKALGRAARLATKGLSREGRRLAKDAIKAAIRTGKGKVAVKAALAAAALPVPGARAVAAVALLAKNKKIRKFVAKKGKGAFKRLAKGLSRTSPTLRAARGLRRGIRRKRRRRRGRR